MSSFHSRSWRPVSQICLIVDFVTIIIITLILILIVRSSLRYQNWQNLEWKGLIGSMRAFQRCFNGSILLIELDIFRRGLICAAQTSSCERQYSAKSSNVFWCLATLNLRILIRVSIYILLVRFIASSLRNSSQNTTSHIQVWKLSMKYWFLLIGSTSVDWVC